MEDWRKKSFTEAIPSFKISNKSILFEGCFYPLFHFKKAQ